MIWILKLIWIKQKIRVYDKDSLKVAVATEFGDIPRCTHIQWQSPNSTAETSERGENIILNKEKGIHLHIFLRKYKQIDGSVQPYIYIGKGDVIEHYGEKPVTVLMKLEREVPISLYTEFTKKV